MKKFLALILVVIMAVSVLASCSSGGTETPESSKNTPAESGKPSETQKPAESGNPSQSGNDTVATEPTETEPPSNATMLALV